MRLGLLLQRRRRRRRDIAAAQRSGAALIQLDVALALLEDGQVPEAYGHLQHARAYVNAINMVARG